MSSAEVVERYFQAQANGDFNTVCELVHEDYLHMYPQSGEVIRGRENYRKMMQNNPAIPGGEFTRIHHEDQTIAIPSALPGGRHTVLISGSGGEYVAEGKVTYPDGVTYNVVSIVTLRGGKVIEDRSYFAEPFEPPEWRVPYLEKG